MSGIDGLLAGKRCLVLDDEFMIALDIQQALENAGAAHVVCAGDPAAALKVLNDGPAFDFAVLDVKMGGAVTSLDIAAYLTEKRTPFIFLTGIRRDDRHLAQFRPVPVVEKPYQTSLLMDAVRQALTARGTK